MGAQSLGNRNIIGEFFRTLHRNDGAKWVPFVSMLFESDQSVEEYKWLGQVSAMREWIAGRNAKGFTENSITIENKHYEDTIEVLVKELRRDKTSQILTRIRELAKATNSHWASLLSNLVNNGATNLAYDGQFFFDTTHQEGSNTTNQSNLITTDISVLPALVHGTPATPSVEEAQQAIMKSVSQMLQYKDNENEPMNEDANNFMVMVPSSMHITFTKALTLPAGTGVSEQHVPNEFNVSVVSNARLTATDKFFTFRTDGEVKPFIRQQETEPKLNIKGEGSEYEFDNDAHQYGVDVWRNVGNGYWQHAVSNQLI